MFGNVNWYLLLTYGQKIEITDLKPFLAGENTSVLIILATTVYIYIYIYMNDTSSHSNPKSLNLLIFFNNHIAIPGKHPQHLSIVVANVFTGKHLLSSCIAIFLI